MGLGRRTRILKPPDSPQNPRQVIQSLTPRVEEWVADALQQGLTTDDVRRLVARVLNTPRKRENGP